MRLMFLGLKLDVRLLAQHEVILKLEIIWQWVNHRLGRGRFTEAFDGQQFGLITEVLTFHRFELWITALVHLLDRL